jgi:hypothetical protein
VAGAAKIMKSDLTTPLNNGGSSTEYAVVLPSGVKCPGDTAHRGFHVFSYLVPKGTSPASVNFVTGVPDKWFGLIAEGRYYGAVATDPNTGRIGDLPADFVWSRLAPSDLFQNGATTATWEGGIACAKPSGVMTSYWNVEIVFKADRLDPAGFRWAVAHRLATPRHVPWFLVPVCVALLWIGALWIRDRRRAGAQASRR